MHGGRRPPYESTRMIRVKICGVTTVDDAVAAADLGAHAVGINLSPKSPRYVPDRVAGVLVRSVPTFTATVGVFAGVPVPLMVADSKRYGLHAAQTYTAIPPDLSFFPVAHVPAFRVKSAADLEAIRQFVTVCNPDAVLVDSFVEGQLGGTGHRAPWDLLAGFDAGVPLILAGGLTPDNVAEAIRIVRPWGVDVASGVEERPGIKDVGKMRDFIQAVRDARP